MTILNFMTAIASILFMFGAWVFMGVTVLDAMDGHWVAAFFSAWLAVSCFAAHRKLWRFQQ